MACHHVVSSMFVILRVAMYLSYSQLLNTKEAVVLSDSPSYSVRLGIEFREARTAPSPAPLTLNLLPNHQQYFRLAVKLDHILHELYNSLLRGQISALVMQNAFCFSYESKCRWQGHSGIVELSNHAIVRQERPRQWQ